MTEQTLDGGLAYRPTKVRIVGNGSGFDVVVSVECLLPSTETVEELRVAYVLRGSPEQVPAYFGDKTELNAVSGNLDITCTVNPLARNVKRPKGQVDLVWPTAPSSNDEVWIQIQCKTKTATYGWTSFSVKPTP